MSWTPSSGVSGRFDSAQRANLKERMQTIQNVYKVNEEERMNTFHFDPKIDVPILILVIGFLIFKLRESIVTYWYSIQCKKWPKTKGKITITPHADDYMETTGSHGRVRRGSSIRLKYEYEVEGEFHEGETISFKLSVVRNDTLARRLTEMYEKGQEVEVYYHPRFQAANANERLL